MKINSNEEPQKLADQLFGMNKKFRDARIKINETEFVATGMSGALNEYGGVIASEQRL